MAMNLKDYDVRYQRARARWSNLNTRALGARTASKEEDDDDAADRCGQASHLLSVPSTASGQHQQRRRHSAVSYYRRASSASSALQLGHAYDRSKHPGTANRLQTIPLRTRAEREGWVMMLDSLSLSLSLTISLSRWLSVTLTGRFLIYLRVHCVQHGYGLMWLLYTGWPCVYL